MGRKIALTIFVLLVVFLIPVRIAKAQWCTVNGNIFGGVHTALGCLPTSNLPEFASVILAWVTGLATVAAIVMFSYGGILIITSAGDPKKVQAGRELIISTVIALVVIVLSVVLLNFVGLDILHLGNFGF